MGIAERKEREKQELRQRIIDASLAMFLEEGYEKTSIRNIADRIEYSPATIYLYYKDKDELLYDVQGTAFDRLMEEFTQKATSKSPWKRLEQICETYVNFGLTQPELYALMFITKSPMNVIEEYGKWANAHAAFEFLLTTVSECIEKGLLRYKDPGTAALSVWSIGHGLVSLHICCRFKVMELEEGAEAPLLQQTIKEYLRLIKT